VRVGIAQQQNRLKKEQAGGPDRGAAAEPGQDHFGDERLNLEEQESAQEDSQSVKEHRRIPDSTESGAPKSEGVAREAARLT
jgi:hypothetical protein